MSFAFSGCGQLGQRSAAGASHDAVQNFGNIRIETALGGLPLYANRTGCQPRSMLKASSWSWLFLSTNVTAAGGPSSSAPSVSSAASASAPSSVSTAPSSAVSSPSELSSPACSSSSALAPSPSSGFSGGGGGEPPQPGAIA